MNFDFHGGINMKELYIVKDIPRYTEDHSCYVYIVRAYDYEDSINIVKRKTGRSTWKWDAELADNKNVWE